VTVWRTVNSKFVNDWVNRSEILPYVTPPQLSVDKLDITSAVEDRETLWLVYGDAMAVFSPLGDREYDGHYLFKSSCRGKKALFAAQKLLDEVFTRYRALAIVGRISRDNRAARYITRALGFHPTGADLSDGYVEYRLERTQWETSLD